MTASLAIPTATSQRIIPVKVMDENRAIVNQFPQYDSIRAWLPVEALEDAAGLNGIQHLQAAEEFEAAVAIQPNQYMAGPSPGGCAPRPKL